MEATGLPRQELPDRPGQFDFTPSGKWLLYHDVNSSGKHGLFRVAAPRGAAERLGDFPTNSPHGTMEISPDGSKIVISAGEYETGYELWSLENFVPPASR